MAATIVPCKVCRHSIDPAAEICSECNNYQDWTRHLFRWKDVIVAVAALAPLWVGAAALRELMQKPEADIHVLPLRCDNETLIVAAANLGKAAGLIGTARLKFVTAAGLTDSKIRLRLDDPANADAVLAPAANRVLSLKPYIGETAATIPYPKVDGPCSAIAEFDFMGFDGSRKSGLVSCTCPSHQ